MTKFANFLVLTLAAGLPLRADFSYTSATKSGSGAPTLTKHYLKGQKLMTDGENTATILDFDAQTITTIHKGQMTYSVMPLSDSGHGAASNADVQIDVRETGQTKTINGYTASEIVMTMSVDLPQATAMGGKMQLEMDMWRSADIPGVAEWKAFYEKNATRMTNATMGGAGNPGVQKGMAGMQKKMASMGGLPVLQVTKMKPVGGGSQPQMPQMGAAQQQQMAQARSRLEEMAKQGGAQGAAAQQALARMGRMAGGGASSGSMFETTTELTGFSTSGIPDSVFAIPAGYQKAERP